MEPAPADTASGNENKKGRGRPKGAGKDRVRTAKFELNDGLEVFAGIASRPHCDLGWSWDGTSYPKTKRSHGPNQEGLNRHTEPLKLLLQLAPNGYPDP